MRFAYLILAHRDFEQLQALVRRLLREDPGDHVVIHYDRRSLVSDAELVRLGAGFDGNVTITPRIECLWGHHSLVEAELLLRQSAMSLDYDYAHLISGQDWPVVAKAAMVAALEPGSCYLSFEAPDMSERMDHYHFHDRMLGPNPHPTAWAYRKDMALRRTARLWTGLVGPRTCPFGSAWKKGSAWWSLPKAAVDRSTQQIEALVGSKRLRHTLCSDEHVTPTILHQSEFGTRIAENRRFIVWPPGSSSPEILRGVHEPAIRASDAWFARKVDRHVDPFFLQL